MCRILPQQLEENPTGLKPSAAFSLRFAQKHQKAGLPIMLSSKRQQMYDEHFNVLKWRRKPVSRCFPGWFLGLEPIPLLPPLNAKLSFSDPP